MHVTNNNNNNDNINDSQIFQYQSSKFEIILPLISVVVAKLESANMIIGWLQCKQLVKLMRI